MAVFIVCEFDPFHYGHEYIINKAHALRPGEPVICIMSGNFVQRGRPALYDEYLRARCAIEGGADLVLSLPFPWCCGSAEHFARGAVSVIAGLCSPGDVLVFGSECGDPERLERAAKILSSPEFEQKLARHVKTTRQPYAAARQALFDDPELLSSQNDILGVEYVKAFSALCPDLNVIPVKRSRSFESSTEIRQSGSVLTHLPPYNARILSAGAQADLEYAGRLILSHLRESPYEKAADGENGLIGRLHRASFDSPDLAALFSAASASGFTNARIRRVCIFSYLGVSVADLREAPLFTQLLAGNRAGTSFLADTKKTRRIAVLTKPSKLTGLSPQACRRYSLQCRADRLYCFCTEKVQPAAAFIKATPYISES